MAQALILSSIWPEPTSSAAGVRTLGLGHALQEAGYSVTYGSASPENPFAALLRSQGFATHAVLPNDSTFDAWLAKLAPEIVIFDRFMLEEQFGWRVRAACPTAVRVLDTIDLHFVRRARQRAVEERLRVEDAQWASDDASRELASILRCDLSLLVSDWEWQLLTEHYRLPQDLLALSRIAMPDSRLAKPPAFSERKGFAWIGNFRHAPNWDAVQWLALEGWSAIRRHLPTAELHLYGAYPLREAMELHDPEQGIWMEGQAPTASQALERARVNLAPLRFGAGVKGKILEGWWVGTPALATPIAAEGMCGELPWGGQIADLEAEAFAQAAVQLHEDEARWHQAQANGHRILDTLYRESVVHPQLIADLKRAVADREARRARNWQGQMLWLQSNRSTEYFSRWIEVKTKLQGALAHSNNRSSLAP